MSIIRRRRAVVLLVVSGLLLTAKPSHAQAPPTVLTYQLCLLATPNGGASTGTWRLNFLVQGSSIVVTGDKPYDPDDNWGVLSGSMIINTSGEIIITATSIGWNNSGTSLGYAGETIMFRASGAPYTSWLFRQARFGATVSGESDKIVTGTATVIACS